ncbi:secretion system protein E [Chromatiales bacterium (ex Bugula neritina AB1)]|nr:secretion system protein E [Chromatiales bacterium (ex Bugula neritina AB1)]
MEVVVRSSALVQELVQNGLLSADQLQIGLLESKKTDKPVEKILLELGFVSEALLRDAQSEATGGHVVDLDNALPDLAALELIPEHLARRHKLLPVSLDSAESILLVAMVDPFDLQARDRLRAHLAPDTTLKTALATESGLLQAIDRYYGFELSIDGILHEIETAAEPDIAVALGAPESEYSQPVVRLVEAILSDAVKRSASDIHFEPEAGFVRIRYRIDGVMRQVRSLHIDYWSAITVRLKVLAELNIAETRAPQDGRISYAVANAPIEFRVSILPTLHGENIVLRILDHHKGIVPLQNLDMGQQPLSTLHLMMKCPEGLILVTGPTGSGKTTTLYSMLNQISDERLNIMTMEDPVEYPVPLMRQTSVNGKVKLDFAAGIRAILRQDPDVILVGEIRDGETAEMAVRASMTGHQVYSTLHANTAIGALQRLANLGVDSSSISANLVGVVGQRLVRKLCKNCRKMVVPDERYSGLAAALSAYVYEEEGCQQCDHQGYRGRLALMEVLRISPVLEDLILANAAPSQLLMAAREEGYRTLLDDAVRRVNEGATSLEEVSRVIDITNQVL